MATTMTGVEFDTLPYEEGRRWELIDGELIPVSSPTPRHQDIVLVIVLAVQEYLRTGAADGLASYGVEFAITDNDRVRPDVCILLGEKARRLDRRKVPIPGAPDIAIEVISPSDGTSESYEKMRAYLRSGSAEVWQFYPKLRTMQIHRNGGSTTVEADQQVESPLLPGFALALSTVFE